MKTNSELPLCMLDQNLELNQYDFVLYHLYISNDVYREYYNNMRVTYPNRLMILDNSAYEFFIKGETLNIEDYVRVINELKPDMFILPDVLMDMEQTLKDTKLFLKNYRVEYSKPLAVAQGNTPNELTACLLLYQDMGIENVAIPFHNRFFKETKIREDEWLAVAFMNKYCVLDLTEDMRYAIGRVQWVMNNNELLSTFKHVHLLGSHCPFEKVFYRYSHELIHTMDTGYPVKCAIEGYELFKEPHKPNIIIDEFLDKELDCKELIAKNVSIFRDIR